MALRLTLAWCLPLLTARPAAPATDPGLTLHVAPAGDDANPGTRASPLATLAAAQRAARASAGRRPVTVWLHTGIYYLPETIRFSAEDSGAGKAPIVYAAPPGERPVISGGMRLTLNWTPFRDGIFQAKIPAGLAIDQLFVNGERQHMARYPNYDPKIRHFNGWAADAIAPERVARWADPAGGYIHAMHTALWGDMHWRILGRKADGNEGRLAMIAPFTREQKPVGGRSTAYICRDKACQTPISDPVQFKETLAQVNTIEA